MFDMFGENFILFSIRIPNSVFDFGRIIYVGLNGILVIERSNRWKLYNKVWNKSKNKRTEKQTNERTNEKTKKLKDLRRPVDYKHNGRCITALYIKDYEKPTFKNDLW